MGLSRSHLDINRTEQMRETSEIVTHMPHCVQNSALPLFLNECSVKKDSLFLSHVDRYTFLLTVNTSIYIHFFFQVLHSLTSRCSLLMFQKKLITFG